MKAKVALLSTALAILFAVTMMPSVMAYSGQIVCLTPTSCANDQTLNLNGAGSSATATMELTTNAPSATTINYYVCVAGTNSCSSNSGTDNGWSWIMTPATGKTGSGSGCLATSCEGNGHGTPSSLSLMVTAPTIVTSTNMQEELTLYACSTSGTQSSCNSLGTQVASLSVTSTVPEFGLGLGLTLVIGLFGLLFMVRRKGGFALPSTTMA